MDDTTIPRAAAFLGQALGISAIDDLRDDLVVVAEEPLKTTLAIELDSSAGPAAFVVYAYRLAEADPDGTTGADRMGRDLATLEEAAQLETPGPRLLAHAADGADGFVLATTPAFLRALVAGSPSAATGGVAPPRPGTATDVDRDRRAADLLRMLEATEHAAAAWLAAADAEGEGTAQTAAESDLALFLLDPDALRSFQAAIKRLLGADADGEG